MRALVMLAMAGHQHLAGIRDEPGCLWLPKSLRFWSPWLLLLLCVTTGVQLDFFSDLCWSVMADEFQDIEEISWGFTSALFYPSLYWCLDVCAGGTEQRLLCVGNSSYWLSINCSAFYGFLKCETKAGFPAGALLEHWAFCFCWSMRATWYSNSVLFKITTEEKTPQKASDVEILNR